MLRGLVFIVVLGLMGAAHASSTLRVGSQVLTAGDSQERVLALLGKPSSRTHHQAARSRGGRRGGVRVQSRDQGGEQWHYRRGDHVTVVTIRDGRVGDIEDRRL